MQPVRSMPASVEFYEKLGFEIEVRRDDWGWARLRCGDCRVMLDQSINLHAGIPRIAVLYLYVDDVVDFHPRDRKRVVEGKSVSVRVGLGGRRMIKKKNKKNKIKHTNTQ